MKSIILLFVPSNHVNVPPLFHKAGTVGWVFAIVTVPPELSVHIVPTGLVLVLL